MELLILNPDDPILIESDDGLNGFHWSPSLRSEILLSRKSFLAKLNPLYDGREMNRRKFVDLGNGYFLP